MPLLPETLFNPQATGTSFIDPESRLKAIQALQQQYPGRVPGGSGETGLAHNDSHGWNDMLNEQQEFQSLQNYAAGKDPHLDVRAAGSGGSPFGALPSTYNPKFQTSALNGGSPLDGLRGAYQPHEQWMNQNPAAKAYQRPKFTGQNPALGNMPTGGQ